MSQIYEHWDADFQVVSCYNTMPLQLAYDGYHPDCGHPGQIAGHTITAIQCRMARKAGCPSRAYLRIRQMPPGTIFAEGWVDLDILPLYNGETHGRTWRHHVTGLSCSAGSYGCHNCADVTWELTPINPTDETNGTIWGQFFTDETCDTPLFASEAASKLVYAYSPAQCSMDGVTRGGATEMVGALIGEVGDVCPFAVVTYDATDITSIASTLHGAAKIYYGDSGNIIAWSFRWRKKGESSWEGTYEKNLVVGERVPLIAFDYQITPYNSNIQPATIYEFQAGATNSDNIHCWNDTKEFITNKFYVSCNIADEDILPTSATLGGYADGRSCDDGGDDLQITDVGFYWWKEGEQQESWWDDISDESVAQKTFSHEITGLTPDATYFFQAAAVALDKNEVTWLGYSTVCTFTPGKKDLMVYTLPASGIAWHEARMNMWAELPDAAEGDKIELFGFVWDTEEHGSYADYPNQWWTSPSTSDCSTCTDTKIVCSRVLKGLSICTRYHYRAIAKRYNEPETTYQGEDVTFRTTCTQPEPDEPRECEALSSVVPVIDTNLTNAAVVRLETDERLFGSVFNISLDDSDGSLHGKNFEGKEITITTTPGGGIPSPLWVKSQSYVSQPGKQVLNLTCVDFWDILDNMTPTLGVEVFNHPDMMGLVAWQDYYDQSVWQILIHLIGADWWTWYNAGDMIEENMLNQVKPYIEIRNTKREAIMSLLEFGSGYLLQRNTGGSSQIRYIVPSYHDVVVTYQCGHGVNVTIRSKEVVFPNSVTTRVLDMKLTGNRRDIAEKLPDGSDNPDYTEYADGDDHYYGYRDEDAVVAPRSSDEEECTAKDDDSINASGREVDANLIIPPSLIPGVAARSGGEWADIEDIVTFAKSLSTLKLNKIQEMSNSGRIEMLGICFQQLGERVEAIDARGNTVKGIVTRIQRFYDRGVYQMIISLGAEGLNAAPFSLQLPQGISARTEKKEPIVLPETLEEVKEEMIWVTESGGLGLFQYPKWVLKKKSEATEKDLSGLTMPYSGS